MTAIVARRWCCEFVNDVGEARLLTISLDRADREVAGSAADPVLEAMARALRRAYRKVPEDFRHSGAPVPAWDC
jgi:hypothetical protein